MKRTSRLARRPRRAYSEVGFSGLLSSPWVLLGLGAVGLLLLSGSSDSEDDGLAQEASNSLSTVLQGTGWAFDFWNALTATLPQLSFQSRLLLFSHAAYESGWGVTAAAARNAYNAFNTTAGKDGSVTLQRYLASGGQVWAQPNADFTYSNPPADPAAEGWTKDQQGRWRLRIPQNWRKFNSWEENIRDQWNHWILRSDYTRVRAALEAADPVAYVQALYDVKYFDYPVQSYAQELLSVLDKAHSVLGV